MPSVRDERSRDVAGLDEAHGEAPARSLSGGGDANRWLVVGALGCLLVDIRHDLAEMYLTRTDTADPGALEAEFKKLEAEARERLAHEGVAEAQMSLQRKIAMRYLGQWRSLAVPVDRPLGSLQAAEARFHAEHEREYSYRRDGAPLEIYQLQVTAVGVTPKPEFARHSPNGAPVPIPHGTRPVYFASTGFVDAPTYDRPLLKAGNHIAGPALIEEHASTTVVHPGDIVDVDAFGDLIMTIRRG